MAGEAGGQNGQARVIGSDVLPEPPKTLLLMAFEEGATDIHLDPANTGMLLRFRVDGIVHVKELVSAEAGNRLQSLRSFLGQGGRYLQEELVRCVTRIYQALGEPLLPEETVQTAQLGAIGLLATKELDPPLVLVVAFVE